MDFRLRFFPGQYLLKVYQESVKLDFKAIMPLGEGRLGKVTYDPAFLQFFCSNKAFAQI
jgi:hypothetical protein